MLLTTRQYRIAFRFVQLIKINTFAAQNFNKHVTWIYLINVL